MGMPALRIGTLLLGCALLLPIASAWGVRPGQTESSLVEEAIELLTASSSPEGQEALEPSRSATQILNEIQSLAETLEPCAIRDLETFLTRPDQLDLVEESEHFQVHYTLAGADRATGELARETSRICEFVRSFYHDTHGWPLPVSDGDLKVDVYVRDLGWGVFAYALHEDRGAGQAKSGYIVLDNDFGGAAPETAAALLRASLAHEYFHLIQFSFGYDPEADWFMEQSATMMEGEVFSQSRDHFRYLAALAENPNRRLDLSDGAHEYGAWLWPRFLSERWGEDLLKAIWRTWGAGGVTMLEATARALADLDPPVTLDEAFQEWAVWNAFWGTQDDGAHYRDGASFSPPLHWEASLDRFPVAGWRPSARRQPEPLGASYLQIQPDPQSADNLLTVDVTGGDALSAQLIVWRLDGSRPEVLSFLKSGDKVELQLPGWDTIARAWLVVTQGATATTCANYSVRASTLFSPAGIDEEGALHADLDLSGQPNPFDPRTTISFVLPEASAVELRIFDAQGRLVDVLADGILSAGRHGIRWTAEIPGSQVGLTGVYFCEIRTPRGAERIRLVHLR